MFLMHNSHSSVMWNEIAIVLCGKASMHYRGSWLGDLYIIFTRLLR